MPYGLVFARLGRQSLKMCQEQSPNRTRRFVVKPQPPMLLMLLMKLYHGTLTALC
jgi:hypothetical protein